MKNCRLSSKLNLLNVNQVIIIIVPQSKCKAGKNFKIILLWRCRGSKSVPSACKAGAPPFELHPRCCQTMSYENITHKIDFLTTLSQDFKLVLKVFSIYLSCEISFNKVLPPSFLYLGLRLFLHHSFRAHFISYYLIS